MCKLFLISILLLFYSCKQTEKTKEDVDTVRIDYHNATKKSLSDIPDSILGNPIYVLVKENSDELMCRQFDKVKYTMNKFFLLDRRLKKLIICDKYGNAINKVGTRGNGPEEYLSIVDFDVDVQGNIYCIDGQLDKLFIYHPDFSIKTVLALPFEADAVQVMDNGDMLFALSSWNKKQGEGCKIILTDKDLKTKSTYLSYDEYKDDSYWISMYSFTQHNGYTVYNQPIDNNVYIFQSENPVTLKSYCFNFNSRNVPNEHKKEIEKHLEDFDHYTLLKSPVVATPDYIVGTLLNGRQTQFFVFDIQNHISYEGDKTEQYDESQLIGYNAPYIISALNPLLELPEGCTYPDSVKSHLLQEGQVIVLRPLQSISNAKNQER